MKRIFAILLMLTGTAQADKYAIATRADLNIIGYGYSLPFDTYTNATTWLIGGYGTATNLYDFSPSRSDAAIVGSPCLTFDGDGDYVNITNPPNPSYPFTLGAVVNNQGSNVVFGASFANPASGNDWLVVTISTIGTPQISMRNGTTTTYNFAATNICSNTTTHLQAVFLSDTSRKLYINGDEATIDQTSRALPTWGSPVFQVGRVGRNPPINGGGRVCETYYYAGIGDGTVPHGASHHLVFTETFGSTVYDVSGNGNNGTIIPHSSLSTMWLQKQDVFHYFANNGGVTWYNGTNTVYVPQLINGSAPATNNLAGFTVVRTNNASLVHNRGYYSVSNEIIGVQNYLQLLESATESKTNSNGELLEYVRTPVFYGEPISSFSLATNQYIGALHTHTSNSDGINTPSNQVAAYASAGFDFVCLTDHNIITPQQGVPGILQLSGGVEYTTSFGHFGAIGVTNYNGSLTNVETIIAQISSDGGLSAINHPENLSYGFTVEQILENSGWNFMEIFNSGGTTLDYSMSCDLGLSYGKKFYLIATDDNHNNGDATFAGGYVVCNANELTDSAIITSLRNGNFYSSDGAEITDITVDGYEISITVPDASTITWITYGGAIVKETTSTTSDTYICNGYQRYIRILVTRDSDSKRAWSNPIFMEN